MKLKIFTQVNSCFANSARANNLTGPGQYFHSYKSITKQTSATNMVNPREDPPLFHVRRVIGYSKPQPGSDHLFPVQTSKLHCDLDVKATSGIGVPTSKNANTVDLESKIMGLEMVII